MKAEYDDITTIMAIKGGFGEAVIAGVALLEVDKELPVKLVSICIIFNIAEELMEEAGKRKCLLCLISNTFDRIG